MSGIAPGGTNHNFGNAKPPLILACPRCGQRVVLQVPGDAHCLPCGRKMRPIEGRKDLSVSGKGPRARLQMLRLRNELEGRWLRDFGF